MKTPLDWLAEYVNIKGLSPEEISDGLRLSGTENVLESGVEIDSHVVIGEIREISKHPNADKLQIAKTDVGKANGGVLQIVCGAPNIEVGQKVPVALVGTKFDEFEIKRAKIRDIESNGMLCAEDELSLGDDHSGIMILDADAKVGQKFSDYYGGGVAVIDAELTPNRGDCLSMMGMAREVAATFDRKYKMPKVDIPEIKSKKTIEVEVKEKDLCPRYMAKVVEGIQIGPSPKWMQERLMAAGVRPISNVVDVSNYVMLELGQPLHAFDMQKLKIKNTKDKIVVRKAKKDETIVTLDGQKRILGTDDLIICSNEKPVALAGVMGGLNSEVDDKTTTVVIEAAVFDPTSIRKTAQRLNLRSEASNRFEKGIPLSLPEMAIERAAELLVETSSNTKEKIKNTKVGPNTDILSKWIWVQRVGLRHSQIQKHLGIDIKEDEVLRILKSLGFTAEKFDFKKEARSHVGKPYIFGASYKTHGEMAFDCSYLTDFIYSKIGKFVGYTSLAQYEIGQPVANDELLPGDILFVRGHIDKSATEHYYIPDGKGGYKKVELEKPIEVGHNALYIGGGRIVHARHFEYDAKNKKWKKLSEGKVVEEDAEVFIQNPEYLGARRFVDDPNDYYAIVAPWWRGDIKIEEDILEELARIYGYGKIPATLPSGSLPGKAQNKRVKIESTLRQRLVDQGLTEVITYSFVSKKLAGLVGDIKASLRIDNPLSVEQEYMRTAIWPSLLEVIAKNQDYKDDLRIFELANVYLSGGKKENLILALAFRLESGKKSFYDLKGALISVLAKFDLGNLSLEPAEIAQFGAGQGAKVISAGKEIGTIGIIEKDILKTFGQKTSVAIAEINLTEIMPKYGQNISYKSLPKYPISRRDINMIFGGDVLVSEMEKVLASVKDKNIVTYKVADIYEGKGLPDGKKAVTINLEIGSSEKTLTDVEITSGVEAATQSLARLGGELRG